MELCEQKLVHIVLKKDGQFDFGFTQDCYNENVMNLVIFVFKEFLCFSDSQTHTEVFRHKITQITLQLKKIIFFFISATAI